MYTSAWTSVDTFTDCRVVVDRQGKPPERRTCLVLTQGRSWWPGCSPG